MESIGRSMNSALQLSKRGGGVAFNLSNIRELGAPIKNIENQSSGVIPIMKLSRTRSPMPISSERAPERERFTSTPITSISIGSSTPAAKQPMRKSGSRHCHSAW